MLAVFEGVTSILARVLQDDLLPASSHPPAPAHVSGLSVGILQGSLETLAFPIVRAVS